MLIVAWHRGQIDDHRRIVAGRAGKITALLLVALNADI